MSIVERLSEEECYLIAIMADQSGLDLAEFVWNDLEQDDGCFRAWAFQWQWWRCRDMQQIDCCARSVGKSLSIQVRAFAFPFIHPGAEMVVTAPEGVHLDAVTDKIETRMKQSRLAAEMLEGGRLSFKHKPFHCNFKSGARIMGRIPHRDGAGIKGTHPLWLELDEASDYPEPGWTEINETLKRGSTGAVWRAHGVTRGVRDSFWRNTQPGTGWTVHRYAAMWRPTWTDEERQMAIRQYGSRNDQDYRRNILGEHGDNVSPIFVLHRLMLCVDDIKESSYNTEEYERYEVSDSMIGDADIIQWLDFSPVHKVNYKTFWAGMDVGYTNHPSEILVFAEQNPTKTERNALLKLGKACPPEGQSRLKLIVRVNLRRISVVDQHRVIQHVIRFFEPEAFGMDKTGNGLPLFQLLQEDESPRVRDTVKGYGFSEKVLVDFDESLITDETLSNEDMAKEAGIKRNVEAYATDVLRSLVDSKRLWMPWDKDLISEFQGQTYKITKTTMDQYGKREYSAGKFHALDAARMAGMAWKQYAIEEMMKTDKREPVIDMFLEAL